MMPASLLDPDYQFGASPLPGAASGTPTDLLGQPLQMQGTPPDTGPDQGAALGQTYQMITDAIARQREQSRQMGLLGDDGLPTQKGVVDAARQYAQGVMMGTTAPGDVPPPGIVAYHGSPADFNRFDDRFIGTGEGAQAYGHGLYFAGNEGVAQTYKFANQPAYMNTATANVAQDAYQQAVKSGATDPLAAARNSLWEQRNATDDPIARRRIDDAYNNIEQLTQPGGAGHMYQVNIGADPEHFLDWDKPLSEQSQHVQDALGKVPWTEPYLQSGKFPGSQIAPKTPEGAQQLKDAGVAGIRYLDQGSRGARDPIKLVDGKPYDPSDPTHLASHAMDMAGGDRAAAASIADRHAQLRAAEGDTAGADAMRQAGALLQSPRTIPPLTEGQPLGSHNYVVFDPATIDILRKYGLAGLMLGGGAAATQRQSNAP